MIRALFLILLFAWGASAQAFTLSFSSNNLQVDPIFSDVRFFSFDIDISGPLVRGRYVNPRINRITYQIRGNLLPGTPSGVPAFNLRRTISGSQFYRQGGSLVFEIARTAVFSDGVQIGELIGNFGGGPIFTLNLRETGTGRYHPPYFQFFSNGFGRVRNADNIPRLSPRIIVGFGDEYDSRFFYDSGNYTIISDSRGGNSGFFISGSGATGVWEIGFLVLGGVLLVVRKRYLQKKAVS